MRGLRLSQPLRDSGFARGEVRVIRGVEALFFDELPQSFNQVEVGRVRRKKTQLNLQAGGESHNLRTALIASIIQDHRDGDAEVERGKLPQEGTDLGRGNVGVVGDGPEFMGDRVECPQDVEPLPPGGGPQEDARHGPEEPQEGS